MTENEKQTQHLTGRRAAQIWDEEPQLAEAGRRLRRKIYFARKTTCTQQELSRRTGMTQQLVSKVERGNPTLLTLLRYLDGLDLELDVVPRKK